MQHPKQLQFLARNAAAHSMRNSELTLSDLFKSIKRRRKLVLIVTGASLALGVAACLLKTPRYEASAAVQVQKDNPGPLGLNSAINEGPMPSDAIDYNITLQTDAQILRSEPLAVKTIEDLHLEQTHDYRPRFSPVGYALSLIGPKVKSESAALPLDQSPVRRAKVLRIFGDHLKVKVQDGTRLISVSYSDPDPRLASAVVNHLVEGLKSYDSHARSDSTQEATGWLGKEMAELRKNAEDANARVADIQKSTGVFTTGDTDANGRVIAVSVVLARLQDLNNSLTAAQTNSILKEAVYRAVQSDGAESISGLSGNILSGAAPNVVNSLNTIQTLRAQEASIKTNMAQGSAKYGANFPSMVQMQKQVDEIERSIHAEQDRIKDHAKSDYMIARQTESNIRSLYDKQKGQADAMNNKGIEYMVAKQEADQERSLYNDMYRRIKEAGALEGLRRSDILVMNPGAIPGKPKSPNPPLYLGGSVVVGLLFGAFIALLVDVRDRRLLEIAQVEHELGVSPVAVIPATGKAGSEGDPAKLLAAEASGGDSPLTDLIENPLYLEGMRSLRTAITSGYGLKPHSVLLLTGCGEGDRVTGFGVHLAAVFARQGYKILLVEADLRKPMLKDALNLRTNAGLANMLNGNSASAAVQGLKDSDRLGLLHAGEDTGLSSELLGSEGMKALVAGWRAQYDYVLIIAPPVLSVSDALALRGLSDLVLLWAGYAKTERKAMSQAFRLLSAANDSSDVGVVVYGVPENSNAHYEYYGSHLVHYGANAKESA